MPKPSAIVQRFKFKTHSQQPGETIAKFLAELRQLTEYCEFGAALDRLVCGVKDIKIQGRLLAEPKLTLQRALDLALAIEATEKDASEIQEGAPPLKVDTKDGKGSEINCYRCGGKHYPKNCNFNDARCYACDKLGHLSRVCQTKKKDNQTPSSKDKKSNTPTGYPPPSGRSNHTWENGA